MLFYNDEGTENGGLVFGGHKNAQGEVVDSGAGLMFDRYAGSQIVQLAGVHDNANHIVGLIVSDTDDKRSRRVFVGHDKEGAARVALMDGNGRPRIMPAAIRDKAKANARLSIAGLLGRSRLQSTPSGYRACGVTRTTCRSQAASGRIQWILCGLAVSPSSATPVGDVLSSCHTIASMIVLHNPAKHTGLACPE